MQYFVIGNDGSKFGPTDLETLNEWIVQNRLTPQMLLESADTGEQFVAANLPGLNFSMVPPQSVPEQTAAYPRSNPLPAKIDDGSMELRYSWIFFGFSFLCFWGFLNIMGISLANQAMDRGHPGGKAAKTANIVVLFLVICLVMLKIYVSVTRPE